MTNAITMLTAKIIIKIIRKIKQQNKMKKNQKWGNNREKELTKQEILGLIMPNNP